MLTSRDVPAPTLGPGEDATEAPVFGFCFDCNWTWPLAPGPDGLVELGDCPRCLVPARRAAALDLAAEQVATVGDPRAWADAAAGEDELDPPPVIEARTCRICGCTDDDCRGCVARTGVPCLWVLNDLCSACVRPLHRRYLELLNAASGVTADARARRGLLPGSDPLIDRLERLVAKGAEEVGCG